MVPIPQPILDVLGVAGEDELAARRRDLITQALEYGHGWRCPGCGGYISTSEAAESTALLYQQRLPGTAVLSRWWLRPAHPPCAPDPVQEWEQAPALLPMPVLPADTVTTAVLPAGDVPSLTWQQAAPSAYAIRIADDGRNPGAERLADAMTAAMTQHGAEEFYPGTLQADDAADLPPLPGWHVQADDDRQITVWMPAPEASPRNGQADREGWVRLATFDGLSTEWVRHLVDSGRLLMICAPPPLKHLAPVDVGPRLPEAVRRRMPAWPAPTVQISYGGMMTAGRQHPAASQPPAAPPPATAHTPIDVTADWQTALHRASTLADAVPAAPGHRDGGEEVRMHAPRLLALLMLGMARDSGRDVAAVTVEQLAPRLDPIDVANTDFWVWLDVMIRPTTADDALVAICGTQWRTVPAHRVRLPAEPSTPIRDEAYRIAVWHWLAGHNLLQIGDRVRYWAEPGRPITEATVTSARLGGCAPDSDPWLLGYGRTDLHVTPTTTGATAQPVDLADVVLADPADPRAARVAAAGLLTRALLRWTPRPHDPMVDHIIALADTIGVRATSGNTVHPARFREDCRLMAELHHPGPVKDLLTALAATPDGDVPNAIPEAIRRLRHMASQ